jgi:hypothetical protein
MKSPTPGPATPAVSKYDTICQRVFGSADYDDYLRTSLTATAFLGRQVANVHQEVVNTLRAAESLAVKARGADYKAPSVSSTLRRKKAMHAFGMAMDFDILENPYILDESGEAKLDQQLVEAYNHIAQFMLGKSESDIPKIRQGRAAFGDGSVGAVYDALKEESDAMKQYFAMMNDSSQLNDFLAKTWPTKHPGQTAPSASDIQSQMQTDYETLGGTNASGKKTPSANGDRPFAPSSSGGRGDPATGFLNMDKDFVLAMTQAGFAWGAIDFGRASGDVQHFDTRLLKFGRQAYNGLLGRFPSASKT